MKTKILQKSKDGLKTRFLAKNCDTITANAMRRAMIAQVPTMAIEEAIIVQNNSALYDEVLAHRLGLVPLTTDLKNMKKRRECGCKKGCDKCVVTLKLEAKGPCMVYAKDMETSNPKVKPAFPNMLIVELLERQELKLEAKAILGTGAEHTKWSPCWATYQYYPKIEILGKGKDMKKLASVCPKNVFNEKGEIINLEECHLCLACVDELGKDKITVESDKKKFIFTVESFGQLQLKEIVSEAAKYLEGELKEFAKQVKK